MRILLTLSGLMLLCASAVTGAGTLGAGILINQAQARVHAHVLPEPGGLVVLGVGFVLLAHQVRRKK